MTANTLILYDTLNDKTIRIAHVIAEHLRHFGQVETFPIFEVPIEALSAGFDLLIVGGPSSMQLLSWEVASEHGIDPVFSDLLRRLPDRHGAAAAVYDLGTSPSDWGDESIATYISQQLAERGYRLIVPPEQFRAQTPDWTEELEDCAIQWADEVASAFTLSSGQYVPSAAEVGSAVS